MKKKIKKREQIIFLVIFMFINVATLFGKLIDADSIKFISMNDGEINDYVISPDSKYIYAIDDSNTIKKFNYDSGELIWSKKITNDTINKHLSNWIFLSQDAKAYCTLTYPGNYQGNCQINFFDIENDIKIDSMNIQFNGIRYDRYYFIVSDFNSNQILFKNLDEFILTIDAEYSFFSGFYYGESYGVISAFAKENQTWKKTTLIKEAPKFHLESPNSKYSFFTSAYGFNYSFNNNGEDITNIHSQSAALLISPNDTINICHYYKYSHSKLGKIDSTLEIGNLSDCKNFTSGFFSKNNKFIFLTNSSSIYRYDITNRKMVYFDYLSNIDHTNLFNTAYDNYFWAVKDTIMHIYGIDINNPHSCKYISDVEIKGIDKIKSLKNSRDLKYLFFTDSNGNIYRLKYRDIFKLHADFSVNDTLVFVGDTVSFENKILGKPNKIYWDFGDGTISTEANPIHIYKDWGLYTVKLTIENNEEKDSIIKSKYINVLPNIKPMIDYSIKVDYPTKITFRNITVSKYDSLKWEFEDGITALGDTVEHLYYIPGEYPVKLIIYYFGQQFVHEELIKVDIRRQNINNPHFIYEFTDTNYRNYIAYKAYDDISNHLIYHVKNKDSYFGLYKSLKPVWSKQTNDTSVNIFKRSKDIFAYVSDSLIYNFDWNNNIYETNNNIRLNGKFVTCRDSNIVIFNINPKKNEEQIAQLLDFKNQLSTGIEYTPKDKNDSIATQYRRFAVSSENKYIDYLLSAQAYYFDEEYDNGFWYEAVFLDGYRTSMPLTDYINLLRINDNDIVVLYPNSFAIFNTNNKKIVSQKKYTNFNFRNIEKISNKEFIIAGDSAKRPAFWIFDNSGNKILSIVLRERIGIFNFAYKSFKNTILLSGWRYKNYPIKNPYYLKISYISLTTDSPWEIAHKNLPGSRNYIFPNPADDYIEINLDNHILQGMVGNTGGADHALKDVVKNVKIYNVLGELVISDVLHLEDVAHLIRLNVSSLPAGVYFVRVGGRMLKFLKM